MHRFTPFRSAAAAVAAAVVAVALALGAAGNADAAQITNAQFHCNPGVVTAHPPVIANQQAQYAYWYPVIYRYTASGWQVYATPGYFYAGRFSMSFDWFGANDHTLFNGQVAVAPGYYYAVVHWVYDNGWTYRLAVDGGFYATVCWA